MEETEEKAHSAMECIRRLFREQPLGVLSTRTPDGHPHASLVAFAAASDLRFLVFATPETTRKYANLISEPRIALLVDNRSNRMEDFHQAAAVTASGLGEVVEKTKNAPLLELYLEKHPHLKDFVASPTCALVRMTLFRCSLVTRFQNVIEWIWER